MSLNMLNELQEIIECILEKLPVKEINKFMILNKLWRNAGERVKRKRINRISWCTFKNTGIKDSELNNGFFKNMSTEPRFILSFITSNLQLTGLRIRNDSSKPKYSRVDYKDFLIKSLPLQSIIANIVTQDITTYDSETNTAEEEKNKACCLLFPQLEDLSFQVVVNTRKRELLYFPSMQPLIPRKNDENGNNSSTNRKNIKGKLGRYKGISRNQGLIDEEKTTTSLNNSTQDARNVRRTVTSKHEGRTPKLLMYFGSSGQHLETLVDLFQCPTAGSLVNGAMIGTVKYPALGIVVMGSEKVKVATVWLSEMGENLEEKLRCMHAVIKRQVEDGGAGPGGGSVGPGGGSVGPGGGSVGPGAGSVGGGYNVGGDGFNVRRDKIYVGSRSSDVSGNKSNISEEPQKINGCKSIVGLMFSCQGRGKEMYGSRNVESAIFSKVFPGVPLMGTFGHGEIGHSVLSEVTDEVARSCHANLSYYCTVFAMIAVKK